MARVTGVGGVFYTVADPARTRAWYRDNLGADGPDGPQFNWADDPSDQPYSLLSGFPDGEYLRPSQRDFMINLRVDDLDEFVEGLVGRGIEILDRVDMEYGKFAWLVDCDGVKVELWEQRGPAPDRPRPT
jgi:catechol 2,3-dioxygenase-like lactoylglutathione lyase family enzyme